MLLTFETIAERHVVVSQIIPDPTMLATTPSEDEAEEAEAKVDSNASDARAKDTVSRSVLQPMLNSNVIPLYSRFDFNATIPASDLPSYRIASLHTLCYSENYNHYKYLNDIQSEFLSDFTPASSIHSLSAVEFYEHVLNAPSFVIDTLKFGYKPGRL